MRTARHILFTALVFSAVACSEQEHGTAVPAKSVTATVIAERNVSGTRASLFDAPIEVGGKAAAPTVLPAAEGETPLTRTILDADWLTTRWSPEDSIAIWAADRAGNYQFARQTFVRYVQTSDDTAVFTGKLSSMPAGRYSYLAFYPVPEAGQVEGTQLTYTLPQVQDGTYRAELDVLSSGLVEGPALTDKSLNETIFVPMRHRYHALRIGIPAGRNHYGAAVARVLIDFPQEVVGRTTFDITRPEELPALTDGSRRIDVQLQTPFESIPTEEQYIWAFVAPVQIDGPVAFTVVYEDGFCAETLSIPVRKTLAAGRVTPIYLTASDAEQPLTWFDFTIDHSQLGEAVDRLTIDAPEGVEFRSSSSVVTNGRCSFSYYDILCPRTLQGAEQLTLHYDSAHALVSNTCTLPATLNEQEHNAISVKAPYLLEENFSAALDFSNSLDASTSNPKGVSLADAHLDGWTAARVAVHAGRDIQIAVRHETIAQYPGRLDTPLLPLKTNAKLKVVFDTYRTNSNVFLTLGKVSGTAATSGNNGVTDGQRINPQNDSYSTHTAYVDNVATDERISWIVERTYNTGNAFVSRTWYAYFDNIRVSIAQ